MTEPYFRIEKDNEFIGSGCIHSSGKIYLVNGPIKKEANGWTMHDVREYCNKNNYSLREFRDDCTWSN